MTDMLEDLAEVVREIESVAGSKGMMIEKMHIMSASGLFIRTHHATIAQNAELVEKYKWQVRDTCTRAEKAEKQLNALKQAMNEKASEYALASLALMIGPIRKRADEIMRGEE